MRASLLFSVLLAAPVVCAGEASPSPGSEDMAEKVFKTPVEEITVEDPEKAAVCPVCGEALWKHAEPGFECKPRDRNLLTLTYLKASCPVCGFTFQAPEPGSGSRRGEVDTDFCRHPVGQDSFAGTVWLCPRCGFAREADRFNRGVTPETVKYVREKVTERTVSDIRSLLQLPEAITGDVTFLKQLDIPETIKYRNALALIDRDGEDSPLERARLYLEAVHAARRAVDARIGTAALTRGLLLIDKALKPDLPAATPSLPQRIGRLEAALREGAIAGKRITPDVEYCIDVTLAGLYDRAGDRAQAEACLKAALPLVDAMGRMSGNRRRQFRRDIHARLGYLRGEMEFAASAVHYFKKAIEEGEVPDPGSFLAYGYLVGELNRRMGNFHKARSWLEALEPLANRLDPSLELWIIQALDHETMHVAPDEEESALVDKFYSMVDADKVVELNRPRPSGGGEQEAPVEDFWPGKPTSCKEFMQRFCNTVQAFHNKHQKWPESVSHLVRKGYLPQQIADEFRCPESGVHYFYKPPKGEGADFILYHKDPAECECRNILFSNGEIKQLPKK